MTDQAISSETPRIFIVEDDGIIALRLQHMLTDLGYEVTGAVSTGERALERVMEDPPDLMLMDIKLAGDWDGIETAARIRACLDIPIIYCSAYSEQMITKDAQHTQPAGFLTKPVHEKELSATIEMALYKHRMETQLRESEARMRRLIESTNDLIFLQDLEGRYTYYNGPKSYGLTAGDILGKTPHDWFPSAVADQMYDKRHQVIAAGKEMAFEQCVEWQGKTMWFLDNMFPVYDDTGEIMAVGTISRNITARKQAEEALRESERGFKEIYADSPIGIELYDAEGKLYDANQACLEIFGVSDVATIKGFALFDDPHLPPKPKEKLLRGETVQYTTVFDFEQVKARGLYETTRTGAIHLDVKITALGISEGHAAHGYLAQVQDITERKQMEDALWASEARFRGVFETSPTGIAIVDTVTQRFLEANTSFLQILGYSLEELQQLTVTDITHPEDWEREVALIQAYLNDALPKYEIEKRYICKDGEMRWVHMTGSVLTMAPDDPPLAIANVEDITQRKQAEEALRAATERLQILHEIDTAILAAQSPQAIARATLERLHEVIPYQLASISEIDLIQYCGRDLTLLSYHDKHQMKTPTSWYPLSRAAKVIETIQQGHVHLVPDLATVESLSPLEQQLKTLGGRAYVSVPMIVKNEVVGALSLVIDSPTHFQPEHVEILEELAASLAVAMQQANLLAQTQQDAEAKTLLLHDVNHRVTNSLNMIRTMLELEMDKPRSQYNEEDVLPTVLQNLHSRIEGIVTVHRMLSYAQEDALDPGEVVTKVLHAALGAAPMQHRIEVMVDVRSDLPCIPSKQAVTLALIINELTINGIKHAFGDRAQGEIHVQIEQLETDKGERHLRLVFQDNGPGWPADVLTGQRHNIGLWLIQSSVTHTLDGDISWRNDDGAVVEIQFPLL